VLNFAFGITMDSVKSGFLLWMLFMLTWVSVAGQLSTSRAVIQEAIYAVAATARDQMIRLEQQELAAFNAGTRQYRSKTPVTQERRSYSTHTNGR